MATQETIKQLNVGGVLRDVEDVTARGLISSLQTALDALTSGDTTTAIESFNEIVAFLENVSDSSTLQGIIAGLNTSIAAKYTKPGTGIPASDLAQAVQTILNSVANKANTADVYPKSQTYDKDEVDAKVADAGKVKSVSINDGEPVEPDNNGNVNIEVEAGQGADGVTPHIDQVTGHWFIGDTDTNVSAQGPQGNSGVASGDEVVVVNNLDGEPSDLEQGQVAVLSAGMGKELGLGILAGGGTFADAFDKSKEDNVVFPWLMRDTDDEGNDVTKMIWHVGNKLFVDAFGTVIDGQKNGLTIKSSGSGTLTLAVVNNVGVTQHQKQLSIEKGENNFSFSDIGLDGNKANSLAVSDASLISEVDFGGFELYNQWNNSFPGSSSLLKVLKKIKRLKINITRMENNNNVITGLFKDAALEYVQLSGAITNFNGIQQFFSSTGVNYSLLTADLSGLQFTPGTDNGVAKASLNGFMFLHYGLVECDIRGFDTENVVNMSSMFGHCTGLKKLTVGKLSTKNVTTYGNDFFKNVDCDVLICTESTPPALKNCTFDNGVAQDTYDATYDWVSHFRSIYVPSDAVQAYKTDTYIENGTVGNTGWSKYASIIYDIAEYDG